uniref:Uncharacterized protein n=1 Tax=Sphaerodactylus townsendi TaxID=933632 RepID=A0ACB8FJW7_9SAUR
MGQKQQCENGLKWCKRVYTVFTLLFLTHAESALVYCRGICLGNESIWNRRRCSVNKAGCSTCAWSNRGIVLPGHRPPHGMPVWLSIPPTCISKVYQPT